MEPLRSNVNDGR